MRKINPEFSLEGLMLKLKLQYFGEKAREFQKNIYFCFTGYTKALNYVDHNKLGEFLKRWEYQIT